MLKRQEFALRTGKKHLDNPLIFALYEEEQAAAKRHMQARFEAQCGKDIPEGIYPI